MLTRYEIDLESRLLSVDSRKVPLYRFDLLIVGSGAAGTAAGLAAADAGAEVALLSKAGLRETNTQYAQGGMAAVLDEGDSFEHHIADTLAVGCGLCDPELVSRVVRAGPEVVERLLAIGARFDLRADGSFDLSREGGHSHRRVLHARGDATGREMQEALTRALHEHPRVTPFEKVFVVDLLCAGGGRVVGALVRMPSGSLAVFSAGEVVLATGGAGQLYRETTNPSIATGDGVALGLRAGASVRDMEFVQFHPTLLYIAGAARVLVSEIVRGHGGILRDKNGVRFMPAAHADAELAPRDVVSRAVFERMVATQDTSVYLDLSEVDGDPHRLFPGISRICRFFGIDIARDPVPVRPGAHYAIGGLEVDADGRTTVPGLWAAGECTSSGLHGANRMGSNSLLEALVLGARAGARAADISRGRGIEAWEVRPPRHGPSVPEGVQINVQDVLYSLKSLMWRQLGIEREAVAMADAAEKIRLWSRAVGEVGAADASSWELRNMLTVAHLVSAGAQAREESRGVHMRSDHPASDEAWRAHTRLVPAFDDGRLRGLLISRAPIGSGAGESLPGPKAVTPAPLVRPEARA